MPKSRFWIQPTTSIRVRRPPSECLNTKKWRPNPLVVALQVAQAPFSGIVGPFEATACTLLASRIEGTLGDLKAEVKAPRTIFE